MKNVYGNTMYDIRDNAYINANINIGGLDMVNVWDNVWNNVRDNVWNNVLNNVYNNVNPNVRNNVLNNVGITKPTESQLQQALDLL